MRPPSLSNRGCKLVWTETSNSSYLLWLWWKLLILIGLHQRLYFSNGVGFNVAFNILFGMAFLASSFVVFLVQERSNKAKHVQFVSGVDPFSYWDSAYTWDLINFLLPTLSLLILVAAFDVPAYTGLLWALVIWRKFLDGFTNAWSGQIKFYSLQLTSQAVTTKLSRTSYKQPYKLIRLSVSKT